MLHRLVDPKIQTRSEGVAQGVQVESGVQATKSIPLNDLSDRLNGAETGLTTQRWVSHRIRGGLSPVGNQDRGLNDIFGQFKGA